MLRFILGKLFCFYSVLRFILGKLFCFYRVLRFILGKLYCFYSVLRFILGKLFHFYSVLRFILGKLFCFYSVLYLDLSLENCSVFIVYLDLSFSLMIIIFSIIIEPRQANLCLRAFHCNSLSCPPGQLAPRGGKLSRVILPPTLVIFDSGGQAVQAGLSCPHPYRGNNLI